MPPGDIWTASMHRPVDTRKLDAKARAIVKASLDYYFAYLRDSSGHVAATALRAEIKKYVEEVFEQVLDDEKDPTE